MEIAGIKNLYNLAMGYYNMKKAQECVSKARTHTDDIFGLYLSNWNIESQDVVMQLGRAIAIEFTKISALIPDNETAKDEDFYAYKVASILRLSKGVSNLDVFLNERGVPDVKHFVYGAFK